MKMLFSPRLISGLVGLIIWTAGCATSSRQTESYLAASGFKVVPATTPEQLQQMHTLPDKKISVIKRQGQVFFVYPDHAQNQLYVGRNAQYSAYQSLLLNEKTTEQGLQADEDSANAEVLNAEATAISNDPWGVFGGVWPIIPYAPY